MFQFRGQQLEQVLVDIVLSPYILICLAEQLWVGQAIDACLHTATNEAFASCPQLINLLRSSNSTLSSLLLSSHFCGVNSERQCLTCSTHEETYQLMCHEKCTSISTRMSLHVHAPEGNISTHVPRKVHSISTVCHFMYMNHQQACQLMYHEECTAYQHVCHFPYMNQKETYQLMCHEKCTVYQNVCHFMYMNHKQTYQLMYHEKCTVYQHVCHFMYKNHKETYQLMYRETCTAYQHECHFNEDEQHFGDPLHPFILWFGQLFSIWPQFLNLAIRTFGGRNFHTGKAFCQDWPCFAHHCREK